MQATENMHIVEEAAPATQAVRNVYIDNLPSGGDATVADGSVTAAKLADSAVETAKIKDGAVTKAKLGSDVIIPEAYTLPAATTEKLGGVKQAAAVADLGAAPTQGDFNGLLAALRAAGVIASS